MKTDLKGVDAKGTNNVEAPANPQRPETNIQTPDASNSQRPGTEQSDELSWVMPKEVAKDFLWKRRRETWVPVINVVIAFLAFLVILAQSGIYYQQQQIMDTQSEFMASQTRIMERSLRVSELSERAYVGIASVTANMNAAEILVMLQNIGNIPAKAVMVEAQEIRASPSASDERTESGERINERQQGSTFRWDAGDVQLFPGTPMPVAIPLRKFSQEEVNAILEKKEILYIAGKIQYEDGFGNIDSTTFAFEYNPPPNERWTAHSDLSKFLSKFFK